MDGTNRNVKVGRSRGIEIRKQLIDACRSLLADVGPKKITTAMVLERAGVARGSLYHHFEDLETLIQSAMVEEFSEYVAANIAMLNAAVSESKSAEQFRSALKRITEISQGSDRRSNRLARVRLIAYSDDNSKTLSLLSETQQRLTNSISEIVARAQQLGWVRHDISSRAVAVFIQSYTLGKVVDDIVPAPISAIDWNSLINIIVADSLVTAADPPP
jgi:AcrR family transcriptional regulator